MFWWLLGIVAGITCLWVYSAAFLKQPVPVGVRRGLTALRLAFLLLLIYLLSGPRINRELEQVQMAHLAILLDDSESMNLPADDSEGPSRLEMLRNLLTPDWMQTFSQKQLTVSLWRTSDLAPVGSLDDFQAEAGVSPLGTALKGLATKFHQARLAGIVLVSDGQNTEGPTPAEVAAELPAPLFPLGLGSEQAEWHVLLEELIVPEQAFQDEIVPIQTVISRRGEQPADAGGLTLSLQIDGQEVASREIQFATGQFRLQWPFEHRFDEPGSKTVEVVIKPDEMPDRAIHPDIRTAQWTNRAMIQILRKGYQAVILSGRPGWEVKYLRRALEEDPRLEVTLAWPKPDGGLAVIRQSETGRQEDDETRSGLEPFFEVPTIPSFMQSLPSVDLLILSDLRTVPRSGLTPTLRASEIRNINDWVGQGGKLLVLGGPEMFGAGGSGFAPFAPILPFRLTDEPDYRTEPFFLKATEWGQRSEALTSLLSAGTESFPPLPSGNYPGQEKMGAEVLLSTTEGDPLLAWQSYGQGRVMAAGPDSFWKLGPPFEGSRSSVDPAVQGLLGNFWRETARFLILGDQGSGLRLYTDGSRYEKGDTIRIWCRVSGNLQVERPLERLTVRVDLEEPGQIHDQIRQTLYLNRNPFSPTLYEGSFRPRQTGVYRLRTEMNRIEDEKKILVTAPKQEYRRLHQDVEGLKQAASASGGRYFTAAEADSIADAVPYQPVTETVVRSVFLGSSAWVVILLLALLSTEWILRKQASLP